MSDCLYADIPEHKGVRYCYICAPRYLLIWWELRYRLDRLFRSLRLSGSERNGGTDG